MSKGPRYDTPIARFADSTGNWAWPESSAIDALLRQATRQLFAICRADYRGWLSEGDLHAMLYTLLRQELPSHGLPACAVHLGYPCRLPTLGDAAKPRSRRTRPVDLVMVVPQTIHLGRGRRWEGALAVAAEVKRGYERQREIKDDLAKLAAIRNTWPDILSYLIIMGYRNSQEDISAVERAAQAAGVTLLGDNYWGQPGTVNQSEFA